MRFAYGVLAVILGGIPPRQFSGCVAGTVLDAAGAAVPNADVELSLRGREEGAADGQDLGGLGLITSSASGRLDYDVTIKAAGFVAATVKRVVVDAARETVLPQVKLQLASVTQSVEITADAPAIETANAEITSVSHEDIKTLPISTAMWQCFKEPGVVYNGNSTTVINGLRTSTRTSRWTGSTSRTTTSVITRWTTRPTSPAGPGPGDDAGVVERQRGGVRRRDANRVLHAVGDNKYHGEATWYNRNSAFSANDWFNNQSGIERPFLNQNQFGGIIGGTDPKGQAVLLRRLRGTPHAAAGDGAIAC